MTSQRAKIGLVELPQLRLFTTDGTQWSSHRPNASLISKQVLMAQFAAEGFDVTLFDLRKGDYEEEIGQVASKNLTIHKVYSGRRLTEIDPKECDIWGVTSNFTQQREVGYMITNYLSSGGRPVIVGGSDAVAEPEHYLRAGAAAVVTDKSGGANLPIVDYLLGRTPKEELSGVILANGERPTKHSRPMSPEDWPLPSVDIARQCLGLEYWSSSFPEELLPIGSVTTDIGCDRKCDFCQTPRYRIGYQSMSPERALAWAAIQKEAGARSILMGSDQFLGRILWDGGREEVLEILRGFRQLGMPVLWANGLELRKATLGRGFNKHGADLTPDAELVEALWGWDGQVGTPSAFIPAERPLFGRDKYAKLLPWQEHRAMMRAIVQAGLPVLHYGGVIGFADESYESLLRLEEALIELYTELKELNPDLVFEIAFANLAPIPGTPQMEEMRGSGFIHFDDPAVFGSVYAPSCDTQYLSVEEVREWLLRLYQIGDKPGARHGMDAVTTN